MAGMVFCDKCGKHVKKRNKIRCFRCILKHGDPGDNPDAWPVVKRKCRRCGAEDVRLSQRSLCEPCQIILRQEGTALGRIKQETIKRSRYPKRVEINGCVIESAKEKNIKGMGMVSARCPDWNDCPKWEDCLNVMAEYGWLSMVRISGGISCEESETETAKSATGR